MCKAFNRVRLCIYLSGKVDVSMDSVANLLVNVLSGVLVVAP